MGSDIISDAELDCVGLYCPMPIAQTKQLMVQWFWPLDGRIRLNRYLI